jgi:F-type H+-transporting ATPase subunit epsilon
MNNKIFDLTIYTPSDIFLTSKVKSVVIPSVKGPFQVLINHAPIIAAINSGIVKVVNEKNEEENYRIDSGITELHNNQLSITTSNITKYNL